MTLLVTRKGRPAPRPSERQTFGVRHTAAAALLLAVGLVMVHPQTAMAQSNPFRLDPIAEHDTNLTLTIEAGDLADG